MSTPFLNACRVCGATSYRRVIARDETGALKPNGLYQCSGRTVVFTDPSAWRDGGPDIAASQQHIEPLTPDRSTRSPGDASPAQRDPSGSAE
jgi:hypothetical protein